MGKFAFSAEPAAWTHLIALVLSLAVSLGLSLSAEQVAAVMAVVQAIAVIITRSQVTPTP